ncbi:amidohydrolase family protein [Raoultibacter massiliensis]|uniref:Amidohydrolase family protein n=1 Tax=Raoultibacter massiliensis TaxID=1852371 RepID=A0ABV1JF44_9ACTN|nr:amidohydrolase family protein [Raoultibacter massiliensis]
MTVIDIHAHIYPEKIATRAVSSIAGFYNMSTEGEGTSEGLVAATANSPITNFVVHSVATSAHSVESINSFIASECARHPEFTGFMAMHQDYADPEKEIKRAVELGLKGIKLHPDMQEVNIDDPRLMTVYEIAESRRLPIIMHMGDRERTCSHPARLKKILRTFPCLIVNAAHLGGCLVLDLALELLREERCFLDVSSSILYVGQKRTRELCRLYGTDRILFGSDYPLWDPVGEYEKFIGCRFSDDELEDMLWHNAERFIGEKIG